MGRQRFSLFSSSFSGYFSAPHQKITAKEKMGESNRTREIFCSGSFVWVKPFEQLFDFFWCFCNDL